MKNLFILLTIFLLSATRCLSQNKGYVAISLGPSIPIADFASKNANNASVAGWAKTGVIFDIKFAYKLGKNFGVSALLRGQTNSIDNDAFASELANHVGGGDWNIDSKAWGIGALMFGGYGSFPISNKLSFDAKAMIGFLRATSPEINITLSGSPEWIKQSSVSSTSFSYLFSGGFKFNVGKKICLLADLDYLGGQPEFRNVEVTSRNGGAPQKSTFSQSFGTINFGFGVGLRL